MRPPSSSFPLALVAFLQLSCSSHADEGHVAHDEAPIVDIDNTSVKSQSIGNCWQYAIAGWVESLNKSANIANGGGADMNVSESYWAYWYWFDQLVSGQPLGELETGGWFTWAAELIRRYGIMQEGAFIPAEATSDISYRQKAALAKLNASLASGALSDATARQDRAFVRKQVDLAFGLEPRVVAELDAVFGAGVDRDLTTGASTAGTSVLRAEDVPALLREPDTHERVLGTIADALGVQSGTWSRAGRYAWNNEESYPTEATERRTMLARVQRALHDRQPVLMTWRVDFNAVDASDRFLGPPTVPGRQGAHMTVIEDYQINDVPHYGTLYAGVDETRPDALEYALDPSANIEFFRIKNSWGVRPDNPYVFPGYYDLYMTYLDGPIWHCTQTAAGSSDDCFLGAALSDFVLPAGY